MNARACACLRSLCARYACALQAQVWGTPHLGGFPLRFCVLLRDIKSAPAAALYRYGEQAHFC